MPVSTRTSRGAVESGFRIHKGSINFEAGATQKLPVKVCGLLFLKNGMSWAGYNLFHVYYNTVNILGKELQGALIPTVTSDKGEVSITNPSSSQQRTMYYVAINISYPQDSNESLLD